MKVHIIERILFVVVACTVVFAGLYLYTCLVSIYQSHWPRPTHHVLASHLGDGAWPTTVTSSCISAHTFLLSNKLQDRHASESGIVYFAQLTSASAAAAAAVIEAKVEAFYESKEALRAETRTTICALRPSQGQYGIGIFRVLQAAVPGHEYSSVRDNGTLISQRVIGDDSPPHARAFGGQLLMPSEAVNVPIEIDTINTPHRCVRGTRSGVPAAAAAATAEPNITVGIPTYINNNKLPPLSLKLTTTEVQIIRRVYPADSEGDGFFHINVNNPPVIVFFGQAPGEALGLGINSTSGCNLGNNLGWKIPQGDHEIGV